MACFYEIKPYLIKTGKFHSITQALPFTPKSINNIYISLYIKTYNVNIFYFTLDKTVFFSINTDTVSLMHIMPARCLKNPLNRNSRHGINQIENTLHIKHPVLLNKTTFIVNQTNNRYAYCFFITIYKITVTAGILLHVRISYSY